jgi:hypothetical protein
MSTQKARMVVRQSKTANGFIALLIRVTARLRRKPRAVGVRPEVAALIERNMNERPDIWADLAKSPTPMKSPK